MVKERAADKRHFVGWSGSKERYGWQVGVNPLGGRSPLMWMVTTAVDTPPGGKKRGRPKVCSCTHDGMLAMQYGHPFIQSPIGQAHDLLTSRVRRALRSMPEVTKPSQVKALFERAWCGVAGAVDPEGEEKEGAEFMGQPWKPCFKLPAIKDAFTAPGHNYVQVQAAGGG